MNNTPQEILQHKVLNFSKFETQRIKCTCFDVTSQFILFGASIGSVYVYLRDSLNFRTLAANIVTGSIKILRVSPDGSLVALATESPHGVVVLEHNLRDGNKIAKWRVVYKFDPIDAVTALTWSSLNSTHHTLYASNEKGLVFKSLINSSASFLGTMKPPECIWDCKCPVVQLDCDEDGNQLAISSRVNTVVINFSKSSVKIIGKQERNGLFGAVFAASQADILYASRPLRRLWKAEVSTGKVLKTIKYHDEIVAKITPFFSVDAKGDVVDDFLSRKGKEVEAKALNIAKLVNFGNNVFSWSEDAVFFFDTEREEIIECHVDVVAIKDVAVLDNMLYVLHGYDQMVVSQIQFLPGGELMRMSSALNSDENVQKAIKFIKDYSVNDVSAIEAVIEIISQSSLESKESAVQTIRAYLESLQAATLLLQQQPTPIITNSAPTLPVQEASSPSNEPIAPLSPTSSNTIGFIRSVSSPIKSAPPTESNNNPSNAATVMQPRNLATVVAGEGERRAVSLDAGRDAQSSLEGLGSPRDLHGSLSSPLLSSSAYQSSNARALQDSGDSDIEVSSPITASSPSDQESRPATASAVVSIPVTKIKGKRKKVSKREGVIIDSFASSEGIKGRTSSPRQIFELETKPAEKTQWTEKLQKHQQAERQQQQAALSTFSNRQQLSDSSGGIERNASGGAGDRGGGTSPSSSSTEEHSQSPSSRFSALEEIGERGRKEVANLFSSSPPVKPEPSSLDFENTAVKTYTGTFKSTKSLAPKPAAETPSAANANPNDLFSFMIASATDIVKKSATELASSANSAVTELAQKADELHSTLQRNPSIQLVSSSTQALTNALSQSMQSLAAPLTGLAESTQKDESATPNQGPFFFPATTEVVEPVSSTPEIPPSTPLTVISAPSTPVATPLEAPLFEPLPESNPSPNAIATPSIETPTKPTKPDNVSTPNNNNEGVKSEKPTTAGHSDSSPPLIGAQQSPVIVTRTRVSTPKRTPKLYQMQSLINGEVDEQELLQAELEKQQKQQLMGGPVTISTTTQSSNNNAGFGSLAAQAQPPSQSPGFAFGSPSLSTASTPNADSPGQSAAETPLEKSPETATATIEKTSEQPEVATETNETEEVKSENAKIEDTPESNTEMKASELEATTRPEPNEEAPVTTEENKGTSEVGPDEANSPDSSSPIDATDANDNTPETITESQYDSYQPSPIAVTETGHGSHQTTEIVSETPENEVDLLTALMNRRLKKLAFCNDLVLLMTETTGSLCTINFLLEFYEMNESSKEVISSIPPSIFLKIMANGRSQITRKKTVHATLQTIDNYLWSPRPATLAPQIQAVEILEQKGEKLLEQLIELRCSAAHRGQPLPSFLEDSHVHWGVRLNLNKQCSDTGFAVHYSQGSNLVVQRDGSAYHSLFVPEDACSDTLVENFSSLLDS